MPTRDTEIELLDRLQQVVAGHKKGLTAVMGDHGGILIERRGHMRGIWRCQDGEFAWTPAGYSEAVYKAADVDDAVDFTRTIILA